MNPRRILTRFLGMTLAHWIATALFMGIATTSLFSSLHYGDGVWRFASDSLAHDEAALSLATILHDQGVGPWLATPPLSHHHLRSIVYAMFGHHPLAYAPINSMAWAVTLITLFGAGRRIGLSVAMAFGMALLFGLFPSYFLATLQPLKDPLYVAGVVLLFGSVVGIVTERRIAVNLLFVASGLFLVFLVRPYMFLPLAGLLSLAVFITLGFPPRNVGSAGATLLTVAALTLATSIDFRPVVVTPAVTPTPLAETLSTAYCDNNPSPLRCRQVADILVAERTDSLALLASKHTDSVEKRWGEASVAAASAGLALLSQGGEPDTAIDHYYRSLFPRRVERNRRHIDLICRDTRELVATLGREGDRQAANAQTALDQLCEETDQKLSDLEKRFDGRTDAARVVIGMRNDFIRFQKRVDTIVAPVRRSASFYWTPTPGAPAALEGIGQQIASARYAFLLCCAGGGTFVDNRVNFHSLADIVGYLPRAMTVGLFSPFPSVWVGAGSEGGTVFRLVAGAEMFVWYLLYPLALAGLMAPGVDRRLAAWSLLFFVTLVTLLGLAAPNMGAIMRMRYGYMAPVLFFAAVALARWGERFSAGRRRRSAPEET